MLCAGHEKGPCIMMNPAQGSPSPDAKQEEMRSEGDDFQPKDTQTTDKGYKLPFSVESLISKSACRTSHQPSDSAVLPKRAGAHVARFSPRTFYAESSQGVSEEDSPQLCEKEHSSWYQVSSFSTPPRKLRSFRPYITRHPCVTEDCHEVQRGTSFSFLNVFDKNDFCRNASV